MDRSKHLLRENIAAYFIYKCIQKKISRSAQEKKFLRDLKTTRTLSEPCLEKPNNK